MAEPQASGIRHIGSLDGLRGLAIILVILFHYTWMSVGWMGVQIFFVLSGFLITSILVADLRLPFKTYLARFYWRRSLRIFPLYFGYLLVLSGVFVLTGGPSVFERHWPFLYTYTINFRRLLPTFQDNPFFGHFWSLAVEEQFYLLWPTLLFLLPLRVFRLVIVGLIALGPVARWVTVALLQNANRDPGYLGQAVYSVTWCQLDALALGAGAAVFRNVFATREAWFFGLTSVIVLAAGQLSSMIATGSLVVDTSFGYPINMFQNGQYAWGYTLLNVWAFSLLLLTLRPNPISSLLGHPALVYIGKISYGMYVFHPVVRYAVRMALGVRHGLENLATFVLYFTLVVGVSALSYHLYEIRFLRMKNRRFADAARH